LFRGHLQHIDAVLVQGIEAEHRGAEIAADRNLPAGAGQDMGDQGRGRRFAVGAGDADIGGLRSGAEEQFDIADDRQTGRLAARRDRVRVREAVRDARRQHQRFDPGQIGRVEIGQVNAGACGGGASGLSVVPGQNLGPAGQQGLSGREPGFAEPHDGEALSLEMAQIDHGITSASASTAQPGPGSRR
jgi:hypothetical protein